MPSLRAGAWGGPDEEEEKRRSKGAVAVGAVICGSCMVWVERSRRQWHWQAATSTPGAEVGGSPAPVSLVLLYSQPPDLPHPIPPPPLRQTCSARRLQDNHEGDTGGGWRNCFSYTQRGSAEGLYGWRKVAKSSGGCGCMRGWRVGPRFRWVAWSNEWGGAMPPYSS